MPAAPSKSLSGLCTVSTNDACSWDRYVRSHPDSSHWHLYGWRRVIEETYGHRTHYLAAIREDKGRTIEGVLPLIQLRHPLTGNRLLSMPYADTGGIVADNPAVETCLLKEAVRIGKKLNAGSLELRQAVPLACLGENRLHGSLTCTTRTHKMSLKIELKEGPEQLRGSFKSKLRSQIRKAEKNGLQTEVGGKSLLDEFYAVFARNMRDLGSPVHSRVLFEKVLEEFKGGVAIVIVRQGRKPLAGGFTLAYRDTVLNPWASSLKESRHLASNMLLYWAMLEYACKGNFRRFDFGRSSPGTGACRFKQQWGAKISPLFWHNISLNGKPPPCETLTFKLWKKLPVPVASLLGPPFRKHIGL